MIILIVAIVLLGLWYFTYKNIQSVKKAKKELQQKYDIQAESVDSIIVEEISTSLDEKIEMLDKLKYIKEKSNIVKDKENDIN